VKTKTELETAIENVKDEWLKPCEPLQPLPENPTVGALLDDAAGALLDAAMCAARHNSLVDYITPIVRKQKLK
jgi:hypothetical protein